MLSVAGVVEADAAGAGGEYVEDGRGGMGRSPAKRRRRCGRGEVEGEVEVEGEEGAVVVGLMVLCSRRDGVESKKEMVVSEAAEADEEE